MDTTGPFPLSYSVNVKWLGIRDGFSSFQWCYFIASENQKATKLRDFIALCQNQFNIVLLIFYTNNDFDTAPIHSVIGPFGIVLHTAP
ncbi:hypothetical protein HK096_005684, partial [Nowakowskiella sp. JEL0078]